MENRNINTHSLRKAYDDYDMIHRDRVAYATLWLMQQGYKHKERVIHELEKVAKISQQEKTKE